MDSLVEGCSDFQMCVPFFTPWWIRSFAGILAVKSFCNEAEEGMHLCDIVLDVVLPKGRGELPRKKSNCEAHHCFA